MSTEAIQSFLTLLSEVIRNEWFIRLFKAVIVFVIGLVLLNVILRLLTTVIRSRLSDQHRMLLRKTTMYTGVVLIIFTVLNQFGFHLSALLGAAGILGVAVGFASQTSVSNVISGIFLVSERPFQIGDLVQIGEVMGTVISIDLLSIKVRTFDNHFIRVPNESLIKSNITNYTRYSVRRLNITLGVAHKEDIRRVLAILEELATNNRYCLRNPAPLIFFDGFGQSSLNLFLGLWVARDEYLQLKRTILIEIKERFDAEGIEIPFPHVTLYTGAKTDPLPMKIVETER